MKGQITPEMIRYWRTCKKCGLEDGNLDPKLFGTEWTDDGEMPDYITCGECPKCGHVWPLHIPD